MHTSSKPRSAVRPGIWAAVAFALALAAVALAQTGVRLSVNGKTASSDIRVMNGKAYVPLADMARAMGGKLVKNGDGYAIVTGGAGDEATPAGGANEVKGTRGTLGQMVFTGKWRFEVVSVNRAQAYDSQYLPTQQTFNPNGSGEELVVVHCKLKNAQTSTKKLLLSPIHPKNTALADDQGQSYPPLAFDRRSAKTDEGPDMLPGSATDFAAIFSVPKGTKLKDLVFSLQIAYDDYPDGGTDVRISLGS